MAAFPAVWVDGEPARSLPLPDRGLDFGDGLFETLLLRFGRPVLLDFHLQRLGAGLDALAFPDCLERAAEALNIACAELVEIPWAAVRLTVTRGPAPRGYAPPDTVTPRIVVSASRLERDRSDFPLPARLGWATIRWSSQPLLAGIKHLNRLEQVLAASEAKALGCDEVVVRDQGGHISSVSAGNLFLVVGGSLMTPALETCGIAGTRRRAVMEMWGPARALAVEETHLTARHLEQASELFVCNSLRGLQPVGSLGDLKWDRFPVCKALHRLYVDSLPC